MPENSPTIQDEAGVTRTPTGTIVDQSPPPTSTQPSTESKPTAEATTPPSSEKPKATSDGKPPQSLINEKSPEPKGAPSTYADFKVPEGYTLDGEITKEAGALFKGDNLSQDAAQKYVDFFVKHTKEAFEAPFNAYMDKRQEWRDQISADAEIGGSKLNATRVSISKLIDSFGKYADGFREAMDYTGAGDHPAVVGALYTLSKILTEGQAVRGNGPSTEGQRIGGSDRPSAAAAMYPHLPSSANR